MTPLAEQRASLAPNNQQSLRLIRSKRSSRNTIANADRGKWGRVNPESFPALISWCQGEVIGVLS
jgi:hypothetical protein